MDESGAAVTRSGQSVSMSIYRAKVAGQCRLITITWCKNVLLHGLTVSIQGINGENHHQYSCKIEMKPWYFWRKQGSKRFQLDGKKVDVEIFWDLKTAKFNGETEPNSDYYVAVVCEEEVVLVVGDMKKDAYRKTKSISALIEPILISNKKHIFGKKNFITKAKFNEKGRSHEISIEYNNTKSFDSEMIIKIDGNLVIHVKHLQWKFRGNESISINKTRLEVYWDVHDWLFNPGLRHASFIFKPTSSTTNSSPISSSLSLSTTSSSSSSHLSSSFTSTPLSSHHQSKGSYYTTSDHQVYSFSSSDDQYCLFLYAWKVE